MALSPRGLRRGTDRAQDRDGEERRAPEGADAASLKQHFEELHIGWNLSVTLGGIQTRHRRLAAHGQVWPAPDLYLAHTVLFV